MIWNSVSLTSVAGIVVIAVVIAMLWVLEMLRQSRKRDMAGHLAVGGAPGRETTVRMSVPRVDSEATTPERDAIAAAPSNTVSESILIVEDQASVRKLAVRFLGRFGYEVVEAQTGEEALSLFRENSRSFDLVLTDVRLPGMNGFELCRAIRAQRADQPVAFVSGSRTEFEESGFSDKAKLLEKPYTREQLEQTVQQAIGHT